MSDRGNDGPSIVAILGTARPGNYTAKALALAIDEVINHGRFSVHEFDPGDVDLPLPGSGADSQPMRALRERVAGAFPAGCRSPASKAHSTRRADAPSPTSRRMCGRWPPV